MSNRFWLDVGLSTRLANALARAGLGGWKSLNGWSDKDLLQLPNVGKVGLAELRTMQAGHEREVEGRSQEPIYLEYRDPPEYAREALNHFSEAHGNLAKILAWLEEHEPSSD